MLAIEGGKPVRERDNFLIFGAPRIEEDEIQEVVRCLRSGWIGTGPRVDQFEKAFAAYKNKRFAIAVNSCTAALHLAMIASGVGRGDEVITTPMTFCATINSIIHCGAKPVLADCELKTMNISPEEIEKKITSKTKAILAVHFAGRCCDMKAVMDIASRYNLLVVEDCAHALETEYQGQQSGTFGDISCFSFYVTKNITTGEGGMVLTDDECISSRVKTLALHGMSKDAWKRYSDEGYRHYDVVYAGFKYNMTDMQASLGIHQMKRIDAYWKRREAIWKVYNDNFSDLPCVLPTDPEPYSKHGYHLYTPLIDVDILERSRDWVLDAMTAENIGVGVHYTPVHLHPFYQTVYGWKKGQFPNAEFIGERTVSLPLSPALSDEDVNDVIKGFRKVLKKY